MDGSRLPRAQSVAWTRPQFTREQINAAAADYLAYNNLQIITLKQYRALEAALLAINNWRSSHSYPLNTFQMTLRRYARKADVQYLVAQRIKRLSSIEAKLRRFPSMKLSQMQDLGGCRAVVSTIESVRTLEMLYDFSGIKHQLATTDNYIDHPQASGYRGIHLVYRYFSDKGAMTIYNGLKIEVQLRSQFQHAWATAVETVGTFVKQALKSSAGEKEWLRFFALMGTVIARIEKTDDVPETPAKRGELLDELKHYANLLNVERRLKAYGTAMRTIFTKSPDKHARFYLLTLDPERELLVVKSFRTYEFEDASDSYLQAESTVKQNPGTDAVLVSVDSLTALERAYPNYFADTRIFVELMKRTLARRAPPPRGFSFQSGFRF